MSAEERIAALEVRVDQLEREVVHLRERELREAENFADLEDRLHALSDWVGDVAAGMR